VASHDTPATQVAPHSRARPSLALRADRSAWLLGAAIFVLALLPRVWAPAVFVTVDEAYHWLERALRFRQALLAGDYAATNLVGHPGVTTMWLGALGLHLRSWLIGAGMVDGDSLFIYRALARLPVALANSFCIALAYAPLRRLFHARVAVLAALLWAGEPFLVAHGQLLHVDALLTSFLLLGVLCALVAFRFDEAAPAWPFVPRWRWLVASGACGALALLTKSPAVLLPPMVGLIALAGLLRAAPAWGALRDWRPWLRAYALPLLAWGALAAALWFAFWPAAWVDPLGSVWSVLNQAEADGGTPHAWGNFFFGRAVADPGALFYPVAIAFRLAPWTLLGAPFGLALLLRRRTRGRLALVLLAVFALLFVIMMSIPPKKFDRYALPAFPVLDILAAAGLAGLARLVLPKRPVWLVAGGGALVALGLAANLAWFHPYEIAYYNPLLGGGAAAVRTIPVGWGEGYEQAGAFIMAQPDGAAKPVAAWFEPVLRPFVRTAVAALPAAATPGRVGYVVLYVDQMQRNDMPEITAQYFGKQTPLHVVRMHGIDYAYVYQAAPAVAHALAASFGPTLRLWGYDFAHTPAGDSLTLTLTWRVDQPQPAGTTMFIHVLDAAGQPLARADVPPGGAGPAIESWQAGRYVTSSFTLPLLPGGAAPRWVALGLYNPADGARLPLDTVPPPGAPDDGPNALRIPIE
jgi:4-amino-4-deoxy-L-arabinose transferase-like glycosyltransferase